MELRHHSPSGARAAGSQSPRWSVPWRSWVGAPATSSGGGILVAIGLWTVLTSDADGQLHAFGPASTAAAGVKLLLNGHFWQGVWESLLRLGGGLLVAAAVGIPVGLAIGKYSRLRRLTYAPFQVLRMVSPLSWTPVAIILLGIGSGPVYFLVAVAAVWPVILNTAAGVEATNRHWIEAARVQGAGELQLFRHVLIRSALPHILLGIQLALGIGWVVLVPAEMLGVASGLGYMILDFRDVNDYASIMALILAIGLIGLALDLPHRKAVEWASWN